MHPPTPAAAAGAVAEATEPEDLIRTFIRPRTLARAAALTAALALLPVLPGGAAGQDAGATPPARERVGPEPTVWGGVEYFARATLSDAWAVATQAVSLDRGDWLALAGVTGGFFALYAFDDDIYRHVQEHREDDGYRQVEDLASAFESFALQGRMNKYYAGGVVLGYLVDGVWEESTPRHVFEELLIANLISATTRKTIGRAIGRFRPSTGQHAHYFRFWDGLSLPSGHVANIATLATVVGHHVDFWPVDVALWSIVGAVAYERVADSGHWASDSWLGIFWGHAIARVVIQRREADFVEFGPLPADHRIGGIPVGLRLRF